MSELKPRVLRRRTHVLGGSVREQLRDFVEALLQQSFGLLGHGVRGERLERGAIADRDVELLRDGLRVLCKAFAHPPVAAQPRQRSDLPQTQFAHPWIDRFPGPG